MQLHALLLSALAASSPVGKVKSALPSIYDENVYSRIWRTALKGAPGIDSEDGWPQYTQGAYGNTPDNDKAPGTYVNTAADGWTAGFFPDSLWQLYRRRRHLQPDLKFEDQPPHEEWLSYAQDWTDPLMTNQDLTSTHDLGFLAKPFESAYQIDNDEKWLPVLANMSDNLANRFVSEAGVIRSWDTNNDSSSSWASREDSVLVIIDNMMNHALLSRSASEYTQNETHLNIAISHANKTRDNHVREDGGTFHVCDYSGTTGEIYLCRTAQGLADESTWARGQAWAIYGFAEFYSLYNDPSYLDTAMRTADFFIEHLPEDGLPFWDFDAPYEPTETPRDSSAATIAASGLLLLQGQVNKSLQNCNTHNYTDAAIRLLSSTINLALAGTVSFSDIDAGNPNATLGAVTDIDTPADTDASRGFESILMHATANNNPNAGDERSYDHGLVYGDFYFIEAGNRLLEMRL